MKSLHQLFVHLNCPTTFCCPPGRQPRFNLLIKSFDSGGPITHTQFDVLTCHAGVGNSFDDASTRKLWTPLAANIDVAAVWAFYSSRKARERRFVLCFAQRLKTSRLRCIRAALSLTYPKHRSVIEPKLRHALIHFFVVIVASTSSAFENVAPRTRPADTLILQLTGTAVTPNLPHVGWPRLRPHDARGSACA